MGALASSGVALPVGGRQTRRRVALFAAVAIAIALSLGVGASASQAARFHVHRLCRTQRARAASCQALKLVPTATTSAKLRALRSAAPARAGKPAAAPQVTYKSPFPGFLTPQSLHAAYELPTETAASATQTVAVVDAFNDPSAEADLGVFDEQFGLPPCTTANGCFRKIDEEGKASPLPANEGEWASEISIDVQMARAICQSCHVLLVEANSESFDDLGTAVNAAVAAGATEISNSYAGPEELLDTSLNSSYYDHPGTVVAASSGDCGYLNKSKECRGKPVANFPASSPDVVSVGGTSVTETGGVWTSTVWNEGGSGCSERFAAPLWQSLAANFSATGCGGERAVADVAAIGDPNTGVDVYDSTPEFKGASTGWGVWGGTSVASPIIAAEFGLAGGAQSVSYPAATLYSHLGDASALYDVVSGSNGTCSGRTICSAASGYDGPTGVGSPIGLGAFATGELPANTSPPTIAGTAEQGQTLTLTQGEWSDNPTAIKDAWEDCNATGGGCTAIPGATAATYKLAASDVGSTIRVAETASDGSGTSAPVLSAQTALVLSSVPAITGFTPGSGITGSTVTIDGSGLATATAVDFGPLAAQFTVVSPGEIEAIVPNGARTGKIGVTTLSATVTSKAKFEPTLAIVSFSPATDAPGKSVKIKGVGFNSSSAVSFGGVPAATVMVDSSKKITATVPAGAGVGPITVTNTAAPLGSVTSAATFSP